MNKTSVLVLLNSLAFMLTACVGGATDPVNPEVPYPYSEAYSNGDTQDKLSGVAVRSNGSNGELQIVTMSGTKDRSSRATLVSDGIYDLVDQDGFDSAARITDGLSSISLRMSHANYTAVRNFNQTYAVDGVTFDSTGVLGIVTRPTDIPTEGLATYRGEAEVIIVTAYVGVSLQGQSKIVASFADFGNVNVTMNSFAAIDMMTGTRTSAPVDTITISNMVISNNRFSGGTVATSQNGTSVFLTGANTTTVSEGVFFGFDPALSGPDEVGGMILMQGDSGIVMGSFLAD
ncbi:MULTISPECIES: hypothetical protein [unclassified Yoonia]|uniref:hypothetical protein n=1 Tax=unclassified Yoonia TaxID=2629118 RepID=UPI002B0034D2|nr:MULTISPECIES: hypothetical protein [unclassified Yoonia]